MKIEHFEEARQVSEQLNVLIQIIYSQGISSREKNVLTGLSLDLSNDIYQFCKAGHERDEKE